MCDVYECYHLELIMKSNKYEENAEVGSLKGPRR
jgi:hypothetical protein